MDYVLPILLSITSLFSSAFTSTITYTKTVTSVPVEAAEPSPEAPTSPIEAPKPRPKKECSCVMYIRSKGLKMPLLYDAENFDVPFNSPPRKHGVVKLQYGNIFHLAYVESVEADGVHITEQNFSKDPGCPVTPRVLDFNDPHIIGYWSPVI